MSSPTDNPSWIERGWSLWIAAILRLPRTVLLCVAILAAAAGAYALSGPSRLADLLASSSPSLAADPAPAYRREIVLHATLLEGYDPAGLAEAVDEAARGFAAERDLFEAIDVEYAAATSVPTLGRDDPSDDAVRRAEERIAFWSDLAREPDGTAQPAAIWRRLAERGDDSPMHALEADGLVVAAAQRVSRGEQVEDDAAALARLGETFDAFWSLSAAIAPRASEARVFARLASEDREQAALARARLDERLDALRLRWPSVEWTPSGPGYATLVRATESDVPTWWDMTTLLGASALAAAAAGNLKRFAVALVAALASGLLGFALAANAELDGLVSPAALALGLSVWTALAATLLLSSLASCLEEEAGPRKALATTFAGGGTACLLPLLVASIVHAIGGAGDVPGAGALCGVVAIWSLFSVAVWAAFFPAALWSLRRFGSLDRVGLAERRPSVAGRRAAAGAIASSVAPLTFAASIFLAWGAVHLERRGDGATEPRASGEGELRPASSAGSFALCRAESAAALAETRARLDGLDVVAATVARVPEAGVAETSPLRERLARVGRIAQALPRTVRFAERPDWAAFAGELRGETTGSASAAATAERRGLAEAALHRMARMRPGDVDRALRLCFEAWLARRDREVAAIGAFASRGSRAPRDERAIGDRWTTSDGAALLWIFPKPGVDASEFVGALRDETSRVGGPAAELAFRSEQRRRFATQTAIFTLGVAAAALMVVLQSLRDTAAALWSGGCSLAQSVGLAGWLGIPWHEEWIGTAPLAACAWLAMTLAHRLRPARGDVWTGAPFATLAASVVAMTVALRGMNGDDASLAAASWWAILLAAGWWNAWAFNRRSDANDVAESESFEEAERYALAERFAELPTHPLPHPWRAAARTGEERPARRLVAEDLDGGVADSRSFAAWDEPTQPLDREIADEEPTIVLENVEPDAAGFEPDRKLFAPARSVARRDESAIEPAAGPRRRSDRAAGTTPRRRVLASDLAGDLAPWKPPTATRVEGPIVRRTRRDE